MSSRKYPSGNDKRKKKKWIDDLVELQGGALHKLLKSNTSTSIDPNALVIVKWIGNIMYWEAIMGWDWYWNHHQWLHIKEC